MLVGILRSPRVGPRWFLSDAFAVFGDVQDSSSKQHGTSIDYQYSENDQTKPSSGDSYPRKCNLPPIGNSSLTNNYSSAANGYDSTAGGQCHISSLGLPNVHRRVVTNRLDFEPPHIFNPITILDLRASTQRPPRSLPSIRQAAKLNRRKATITPLSPSSTTTIFTT